MRKIGLYVGEKLARYGFPAGHPFGPDRLERFWNKAQQLGLREYVELEEPVLADRDALLRFHTPEYVELVRELSQAGNGGLLDQGDTPAFPGCYEAAATVVGSVLDAVARTMDGRLQGAFIPIAGLHHAQRNQASGFCIFNDCGVAIATLRREYGLERVAYVDLDAHHGDGVYYAFEADPGVLIADIHEDGRYLFPGTGAENEVGSGAARGTKLNIPLPPGAADDQFREAWAQVERFLEEARPQFILVQCGADSVAGDPITHLHYSPAAHRLAIERLLRLADRFADGHLVATGGGGYNRDNLAATWSTVLQELIEG